LKNQKFKQEAKMTSYLRKVSPIALGALLALGILSAGATPAVAEGERFVLISHAPDSDSWWNTIKNAIKIAGEQMKVTVEYRNPPTGDLADMARIVQQAAASNPDGIIVTIADFDVLSGPVRNAVDKGIPVITINSGTPEQSEKLGALMHVGQPEYAAGFGAGKRAKAKGVKKFLCVNHYITNPASVERCKGYADALGVDLGSQMIDSGQDPSEIKNRVIAYLRSNSGTNGILTLGPTSAHPTLAALNEIGRAGDIHFGTFDLSGEIAKAIKAGTIAFAIDQQPYLQGYLPVVILTNLARYGVLPSGNINSGPGFVVKNNIALVEKYAGEFR
jgi:simple sugar transport system substrate-binding protein